MHPQIAETIRRWIKDKALLENHSLPSTSEFCAQYGVSRTVMRKAIAKLESEGLIRSAPGRGLFVAQGRGRGKSRDKSKANSNILVTFVVPGIEDPFVSLIHKGLVAEFAKDNMSLTVSGADWLVSHERDIIRRLVDDSPDGAVIIPTSGDVLEEEIKTLDALKYSFVLVDRIFKSLHCSHVASDNLYGAGLAVEYLLKLGHRRIGMIVPAASSGASERHEGYCQALRQAGLQIDTKLVVQLIPIDLDREPQPKTVGYDEMNQLLSLPKPPTAVFAGNDHLALGACWAAQKAGLEIPQDISIIGFDGVGIERMVPGGITTVKQPAEQIGREAARLLIEQIRHRITNGESRVTRQVFLRPNGLVIGATTGRPKPTKPRRRSRN